MLALDPADPDALRDAARRATTRGAHEDAARALARLRDPSPADGCRRIDAWMAAGRLDEALAAFDEARGRWPDHTSASCSAGSCSCSTQGDEPRLGELAAALVDRLGPGAPGGGDALLVLAQAARVDGRLEEAAALAHQVVDDDPQDGAAWWVLVQVAWAAGRTRAEPAWLRAAPRAFPPQEALALADRRPARSERGPRLARDLEGIVPAVGASRVEHAATVVDRLLRHGLVGPDLFDRLAALAPEEQVFVEAVRQLWDGTGRAHVAFPVALAHAWCPIEGQDLFRGTHRVPIPGRARRGRSARRARSRTSTPGPRCCCATRARRSPRRARPRPAASIASAVPPRGSTTTTRCRFDRRLQITRGCALEVRGTAVYVVSDEPVEIGGLRVNEARLADGAVVQVGSMRVQYLIDMPVMALPPAEDEYSSEDQSTPQTFEYAVTDDRTDAAAGQENIRAALFFREAGSERILPLVEDELRIGPRDDAHVKLGEGAVDWLARVTHPELGMYLLKIRGEVGPGGPDSPRLLARGTPSSCAGCSSSSRSSRPARPPRRRRGCRSRTTLSRS